MSNHVLWNKQNHTSIDLMQDIINLHRNLIKSLFTWQTTVEEQARTRYSMTPWSPSRFCKDEISTQQSTETQKQYKQSPFVGNNTSLAWYCFNFHENWPTNIYNESYRFFVTSIPHPPFQRTLEPSLGTKKGHFGMLVFHILRASIPAEGRIVI